MEDELLMEDFYNRLMLGIPGIESNNGDYNAQNPEGSATGKYQFTKVWFEDAGKDSIKSFVNNNKDVFAPVKTMEDFKKNPELQEAYFEYYAKNVLYPKAVEASKKNPLKLTLDQIGALMHFQGVSAGKRQVNEGKLPAATKKGENGANYTNVSGQKYLDVFNKTLDSYGVSNISTTKSTDPKEKEDIYGNFKKREEAIDKMNVSQETKEKLRKKLYQQVTNEGNQDIINEGIENDNKVNKEQYDNYRTLEDVLDKATINRNKTTGSISFEIEEENVDDYNRAAKAFPEYFKNAQVKTEKGKSKVYISQHYAKQFAKDIFQLNKDGKISISTMQSGSNKFYNFFEGMIPESWKSGALPTTKETITFGTNPVAKFQEKSLIDSNIFVPEKKTTIEEDTKEPDSEKKDSVLDGANIGAQAGNKTEIDDFDYGDEFFRNELALLNTDPNKPNYGETKRDWAGLMDAGTGLALGIMGRDQAKTKIPLRDEEISNAMKSYIAELSQRSKEGLPVEVEAAMKNELAEAWQGGLATITNLSGGDRNKIIGNLGQLEASKMKGLVSIQLADYEAKERAFAQYGQAIQYANEFDARRDIANHGIKYTEAKKKQADGEQLAVAGFSKLIDGIKYDKENGPGSVNDMYRSYWMQTLFGFDPKMKDNGLGDTPGTESYFKANNAKTKERAGLTLGYNEKRQMLNPSQKKALSLMVKENQNINDIGKFIDYIGQNPEMDFTKISMDNLDLALKENNFGLLSMEREKAITKEPNQQPTLLEPNVISLTDEQRDNPVMGALEPMQPLNAMRFDENSDAYIEMMNNYYTNQ